MCRSVLMSHNRVIAAPLPVALPVASIVPSGLNATAITSCCQRECSAYPLLGGHIPQPAAPAYFPRHGQHLAVRAERHRISTSRPSVIGKPIWWWVATSHNRAVPSSLAVARIWPSGLNVTSTVTVTSPWSDGYRPADLVVGGDIPQPSRPSSLAVARIGPSGLNATATTARAGEMVIGAPIWWWVATSHNRVVSSWLAVARIVPSGLNATPRRSPIGDHRRAHLPVGGDVPQPSAVVIAGGGQHRAVRAERHRDDGLAVGDHRCADLPPGGDIPQPDRAIVAGGGQDLAVRAEHDGVVWRSNGVARRSNDTAIWLGDNVKQAYPGQRASARGWSKTP